jgi:hypothetical protein
VADIANAASLAERLQLWQGEARRTLILLQHHYELLAYAETHAAHHDDAAQRQAQAVRLLQHYRSAAIQSLDFGYILQDGSPGAAQIMHTAAALTATIADAVEGWFAHQRRLDRGDVNDAVLELAPGLRLVDIAERAPDGVTSAACYVAPDPASFHEAAPVSRAAFALLVRVASGNVRPRDVTEPGAAHELHALLRTGLIVFAARR